MSCTVQADNSEKQPLGGSGGLLLTPPSVDFTAVQMVLKAHFLKDNEVDEYTDAFAEAFSLSNTSQERLRAGLSVGKKTCEAAGMALLTVSAACAAYGSYAATQIPEIPEHATWWK